MTDTSKRDDKRARLELRLRENLKRRKEQARARREKPQQPDEAAPGNEPETETD